MGHELNPEGRQHIEERRLLIVAMRAIAIAAASGIRLFAGEEPPADDLGIGGEERDAVALPVHGPIAIVPGRIDVQIRECGFEFHIAAEDRAGRAHQGIGEIVADAVERSEPDQLALAQLLLGGASHLRIVRVGLGQAHLRPCLQDRTGDIAAALEVLFERAAVVEQIEFDEFCTFIFEVHQRAADAANIAGIEK